MTKVGGVRLLKLAAFLEKLPHERFNFNTWTGRNWGGAQDLSCGTTACALGWAATMPEFRRLGLRLSSHGVPTLRDTLAKDKNSYGDPFFSGQMVFGITEAEFTNLFVPYQTAEELSVRGIKPRGPGKNATAKAVAQHIRKFVAKRAAFARYKSRK